ncbi:hypothetical protein SASPL_117958 [Salvia splendens]|uniref:Uncharacterized protein n=1 Tax=Salvia splendens TaxID=180675 RepID=A0A8X8ZYP5_SALSN|nr:hypothetical protein SASPL_117958 [Salvia splendens]
MSSRVAGLSMLLSTVLITASPGGLLTGKVDPSTGFGLPPAVLHARNPLEEDKGVCLHEIHVRECVVSEQARVKEEDEDDVYLREWTDVLRRPEWSHQW